MLLHACMSGIVGVFCRRREARLACMQRAAGDSDGKDGGRGQAQTCRRQPAGQRGRNEAGGYGDKYEKKRESSESRRSCGPRTWTDVAAGASNRRGRQASKLTPRSWLCLYGNQEALLLTMSEDQRAGRGKRPGPRRLASCSQTHLADVCGAINGQARSSSAPMEQCRRDRTARSRVRLVVCTYSRKLYCLERNVERDLVARVFFTTPSVSTQSWIVDMGVVDYAYSTVRFGSGSA